MSAHAKLSASGASRWIACPGSVRVTEHLPEQTSDFAQEGTNAHTEAEQVLLGNKTLSDCEYDIALYVEYVQEQQGHLLVEQRLEFDEFVQGGFGTADAVVISDGDMHIIDLKYGKGIRVDATNNPQLRLYALGAIQKWQFEYQPKTVTMSIVQPRLDHISTETITVEELLEWGEFIKECAKKAEEPDAPIEPGEKQCQFCKAKATCRQRAIFALQQQDTDNLTPDEMATIIPFAEEVQRWSKQFLAEVQEMAENGTHFPGYKLIEGRSVRKWRDDAPTILSEYVADAEQLYEKKLLGITALQKVVGKDAITEATIKPQGKLTLVPSSDKRPEAMPATVDFPIGD